MVLSRRSIKKRLVNHLQNVRLRTTFCVRICRLVVFEKRVRQWTIGAAREVSRASRRVECCCSECSRAIYINYGAASLSIWLIIFLFIWDHLRILWQRSDSAAVNRMRVQEMWYIVRSRASASLVAWTTIRNSSLTPTVGLHQPNSSPSIWFANSKGTHHLQHLWL